MKVTAKERETLKGRSPDPDTKQQSSIQLVECSETSRHGTPRRSSPPKPRLSPRPTARIHRRFPAQIDVLIKAFTDMDTALQAGKL